MFTGGNGIALGHQTRDNDGPHTWTVGSYRQSFGIAKNSIALTGRIHDVSGSTSGILIGRNSALNRGVRTQCLEERVNIVADRPWKAFVGCGLL